MYKRFKRDLDKKKVKRKSERRENWKLASMVLKRNKSIHFFLNLEKARNSRSKAKKCCT